MSSSTSQIDWSKTFLIALSVDSVKHMAIIQHSTVSGLMTMIKIMLFGDYSLIDLPIKIDQVEIFKEISKIRFTWYLPKHLSPSDRSFEFSTYCAYNLVTSFRLIS